MYDHCCIKWVGEPKRCAAHRFLRGEWRRASGVPASNGAGVVTGSTPPKKGASPQACKRIPPHIPRTNSA